MHLPRWSLQCRNCIADIARKQKRKISIRTDVYIYIYGPGFRAGGHHPQVGSPSLPPPSCSCLPAGPLSVPPSFQSGPFVPAVPPSVSPCPPVGFLPASLASVPSTGALPRPPLLATNPPTPQMGWGGTSLCTRSPSPDSRPQLPPPDPPRGPPTLNVTYINMFGSNGDWFLRGSEDATNVACDECSVGRKVALRAWSRTQRTFSSRLVEWSFRGGGDGNGRSTSTGTVQVQLSYEDNKQTKTIYLYVCPLHDGYRLPDSHNFGLSCPTEQQRPDTT